MTAMNEREIAAMARPARSEYVGSGDISAIIGADERRNSTDVWLQKTGRLPETEVNSVMQRGISLEPYVLDLFEAEHQVTVERNVFVRGDEVCCATLDGALLGTFSPILEEELLSFIEAPIEAKTTNMGRDWNQETGSIPLVTVVQTNYQMYCAGPRCKHAFVPALIPEFQRFKFLSPVPIVRRDDELIEELKIAAHNFMAQVKADVQPEPLAHIESLKRIRREPASCISLDDEAAELWAQYAAAGDRARGAEADKEEYKRKILATLGDAEAGRLPDGREIRYLEQNGGRQCDIDRLQILSPDLYAHLVSQPRFRVLRLKKAAVGRKK